MANLQDALRSVGNIRAQRIAPHADTWLNSSMQHTARLLGRVALRFDAHRSQVPSDLSTALRLSNGKLLVASDEGAELDLMAAAAQKPHVYEQEQCFQLNEALGLEAGGEVDIEGIALSDNESKMFLIGSHSTKRKKPRDNSTSDDLERLATIKFEPARHLLAKIPLESSGPNPDAGAALLPREGEGSLISMLKDDPHLGPFVSAPPERRIPGKDNGFDIEGLACSEQGILVGLRGPVLRGFAFVLEFGLECDGSALAISSKQGYRKYALDLDGLGVRELLRHGDDLLVLAGPTMALDGAHRLFRWFGGPHGKSRVVHQEKGKLEPLFDLPHGAGVDRAEGLACHSWFDEDDSVLVVYDAPARERRLDATTVLADVFAVVTPLE